MPSANDSVWISVLPDMKGFAPAMQKGAVSSSAATGAVAGKSFGKAMLAGVAVVAGGAALATKALYNIGQTFDEVSDTIRTGTGATGKALDDLNASAKNVGKSTPASFKDVGTAIADVNTRLGLTGKPLEKVSTQFLELSRITGTDVSANIKDVSRVFGDWGVATKDQSETMDYLFKVSQSTGVGIGDLSQKVVAFGAPLRQLGFDFETSAAMLGKWEKEGVNTEAVLAGMKIGLGEFSKAGKDPVKAMAAVEKAIKGAGSAGEANQIAIETFGQRAGPDMAAAIREGRFDLDELMGTLKGSKETIEGAGKDTQDFSEKWLMFKNRVLVGLEPLAKRVFDALGKGMDWLSRTGVPALRSFGDWFREHKSTVSVFAGAVVALTVATAAHAAVMAVSAAGGMAAWLRGTRLISAATRVWAAVQWVLNAAMSANPIGLLVKALALLATGLVIAYRQSSTFREIVDKAWSTIKSVISTAWNGVIKPAFKAFAGYLTDVLFPTIKHMWEKVVKPTFKAIGEGIKFVWNNVVKPVFGAYRDYLTKVVFPVFRFLWEKVVKPTFKAIGEGIKFYWNNVVKPVFGALKDFLQKVLFPVIRFLWDRVVKPVFSGIGKTIKGVWTGVIKPAFNALKDGVGSVKDAFGTAIGAITKIWSKLKAAVMAPVKFVIDTIINKGLIGGFNFISEKVGGPTLPSVRFSLGSTYSNAGGTYQDPGQRMAEGGVLPGYTPGRDVHHFRSPTAGNLHLSGGEAIMRPEFTRAVGGKRGVAALNARARKGKPMHGPLTREFGSFFLGGVTPMAGTTSVSQHTSGYPWASWAGDLNGAGDDTGKAAVAWKAGRIASAQSLTGSYGKHMRVNHAGQSTLYAHLNSFVASVGQAVRAGQTIGRIGSTGNSSGPHLHFEVKGGNVSGGTGVSGGGGAPSLPGWAQKLLGGAVGWIENRISGPLDALKSKFPDNAVAGLAAAMPSKIVSAMGDYLTDKVSGKFGSSGAVGAGVAGISGPVVSQVQQVAERYGWGSGANWSALKALVQQESSWNPNAANPTSSARGLFQKMTSIHGAVEPTAAGQAAWGLNYIKGRYGSPSAAWAFHRSNNYYKDGGVVPTFDQGGWLKPGGMGVNRSGKPEPVFTDAQWSTLRSAVRPTLMGAGIERSSMTGMVLEGHVTVDDPRTGEGYIRAVVKDEIHEGRRHAQRQGVR